MPLSQVNLPCASTVVLLRLPVALSVRMTGSPKSCHDGFKVELVAHVRLDTADVPVTIAPTERTAVESASLASNSSWVGVLQHICRPKCIALVRGVGLIDC